jgi:PAS domain S-box-containing protein
LAANLPIETGLSDAWRQRLLDRGSIVLAVLSALTVFVGRRAPIMVESSTFGLMMWMGLVLVFIAAGWRKGPYGLRTGIVVTVLLLCEAAFLLRMGYAASTTLAGLTAVITAGLLLGVRWAIGTWVLTTSILLIGGLLIRQGVLVSNFDPTLADPANGGSIVGFPLTYATYSAFLAVGIAALVERLSSSFGDLQVAHDALQKSQAQWESLARHDPDQILVLDRDHRIEFRNHDLRGYSAEAVLGNPIEDFAPPEMGARIGQAVDQAFETGENAEYELSLDDSTGHFRWYSARVSPVLREGNVHRVMVISSDITERRALEDQLRQAQKMEAVGQLASGVAHDFNNLLTVVLGYGEVLRARARGEPQMAEDLAAITDAADRGAALTRQLLAFSREQPTRAQTVSLSSMVLGMEPMLRPLLGAEVDIDLELAPQLGEVHADLGQLEQVLANLVVNARDAMPEGGRIAITTRNRRLDPGDETHSGLAPGNYVSLAVMDGGVGISPEVCERIFDPFFTTKEVGKGTGLGLSTVYGIVKSAGGEVAVSSQLGHGSRFEILLPESDLQAVVEAHPSQPLSEVAGSEGTLLLVEDEDAVRKLLSSVLEAAGYAVLVAADGVEALALVERHEGPVDILLSDVRMPRMGGPDLARRMLNANPELRVAFMTGHPAEVDSIGINVAILPKPFSAQELVRWLRDIFK